MTGNYVEGLKNAREDAERDTARKIADWLELTHRSKQAMAIAARIRLGDWKRGPFRR